MDKVKFDNLALKVLPVDSVEENYVRTVSGACFSRVKPTPVKNPRLVALSKDALRLLDISDDDLQNEQRLADVFSGNVLLPGMDPAAHCYCGHQFGYFSGQLGDGATMYLGEIINSKNERWELQFKGAGKTPYSRTADGRKVLRSSIREFLCSEAMFYLGIPTTRAGTCVTSDDYVVRDIFYDGNPKQERCTIITRIAETFIRFGSFEIFKPIDPVTSRKGPSVGRIDILQSLINYVISTFYPQVYRENTHTSNAEDKYAAFFEEIVKRTAVLVAQWQCVGWCHGVLNTDNMSIVGVTIDYGPYGFMDRFDPDFVCNGSDDSGRYSYKAQPSICRWNCGKLAEALAPVLSLERSRKILEKFDEQYQHAYVEKMRKKFGLVRLKLDSDKDLFQTFLDTMFTTGGDFTNCFRALSIIQYPKHSDFDASIEQFMSTIVEQCCDAEEWKRVHRSTMDDRTFSMLQSMADTNPAILSQFGINPSMIETERLKREREKEFVTLTHESKRNNDEKAWRHFVKLYVERLEKECDDDSMNSLNVERETIMKTNNPRMILRNHLVQHAIELAEDDDYTEVRRLLEELKHPFDLTNRQGSLIKTESSNACFISNDYESKAPPSAARIRVT